MLHLDTTEDMVSQDKMCNTADETFQSRPTPGMQILHIVRRLANEYKMKREPTFLEMIQKLLKSHR